MCGRYFFELRELPAFARLKHKIEQQALFEFAREEEMCIRDRGSMHASVKLKGIDGGPHKRWSMWFNSKQREEPYQALTWI